MKKKFYLGVFTLLAVLGLSLTNGNAANAHVVNLGDTVSFGPLPPLPSPLPLPPSIDPKGDGTGGFRL